MPAQIQFSRTDVTDRFPMVALKIRADDGPTQAEVAIGADPSLFTPEGKKNRTPANFYSTSGNGAVRFIGQEANFVVPPEVLAGFIGNEKLYVGLSTAAEGGAMRVVVNPTAASPYISIKGLTGRSMSRVRVLPSRQQRAAGYGGAEKARLDWAGDSATPGMTPLANGAAPNGSAIPANGRISSAAPPAATPYDDGFGPMPSSPPAANGAMPAAAPSPGMPIPATPIPAASSPGAQSLGYPPVRALADEPVAVTPPSVSLPGKVARIAIEAGLLAAAGPFAGLIMAMRTAANALGCSIGFGPQVGGGLGAGGQLGYGIIFGKDGDLGLYGAAEIDIGFITSISATVVVTIVQGGIEAFNGWNHALAITSGEGVVGGAAVLLNDRSEFVGCSASAGIGVGFSPVDFYVAAQRGWAARVMALAMNAPAAQGMSVASRSRAMDAESFTLNWDDVELIPQPTGNTCWAASGAMLVGWRDRVSLSPETVAAICGRSTADGLSVDDNSKFASEMGFVAEPPQSYSVDGFRTLLHNNGPLWMSEGTPPNLHAIVVTGMYSDGTATFVRIADPWDRVVGTPGAPGGYLDAHATGSRYIMRWEDFQQQYEAAITGTPPNRQILHNGGMFGHVLNTGEVSPPPGYAQSYNPPRSRPASRAMDASGSATPDMGDVSMPPPPPPRARAMSGAEAAVMIGGFLLETVRDNAGGVTWELDQFRERKHPNDILPTSPAAYRDAPTIRLDQWPASGGLIDDISAWFAIDWQFNGTSLGNVRIGNIGTNDAIGWSLAVRAQIMDDNILYPPSNCAALRLRFHYRFSRNIGSDVIAITDVHLYGDGTHEVASQWVQSSALSLGQLGGQSGRNGRAPARAMDGALISAIGIAVGAVSDSAGDIAWELDAFNSVKHPNDVAPQPSPPLRDAPPIQIKDWTMGMLDEIGADFQVDWQYNGTSVGNIRMKNIYINDAIFMGLKVKATIAHDNAVYDHRAMIMDLTSDGVPLPLLRADETSAGADVARKPCAAMRVHFDFTWEQTVGPAHKAEIDLHLFGDGTHSRRGRWVQHSFL